jgi:hypothetical protein
VRFTADVTDMPDNRTGYYEFEVILGNEIDQYNNFTLGM